MSHDPAGSRRAANAQRPPAFLRSINICFDAAEPARIAHYQPTAKSAGMLEALLGQVPERAFFVVAPYGSGKSLTATYLLNLVENREDGLPALRQVESRLAAVSPTLGKWAATRRKSRRFGLVLTLHGHCASTGQRIKAAALESMARCGLGREARPLQGLACESAGEIMEFLNALARKVASSGGDRIVILWDEFGRHVQSLLADGRPSALLDVQNLAEFVSRQADLPMTLGLLLHQGLLQQAGNISHSVRTEWTKIEGRFRTIQYVDDSKEIYRLIADLVSRQRDGAAARMPTLKVHVERCRTHGLFCDFTTGELEDLLKKAYPLEPTTLYLLPRLSARVAQNERTLFSYLYSNDLQAPVGPDSLYDYFAASMRSDTAVGGTYRQWLETQSALSKVADDGGSGRILKTACLLALGKSGERSRSSQTLLEFAVQGYRADGCGSAAIRDLIDRKLLLHRKHSDEVSVWHGTDVDLRGKLEEEKQRYRGTLDLVEFLTREAPPPTWRPLEHNDEVGVRRHLKGRYCTVESARTWIRGTLALHGLPVGCDGVVVYLLVQSAEELADARAFAREEVTHDRLFLAIPSEPIPVEEVALEVFCLLRMQLDQDLLAADPLVSQELQQLTDDAREHLQRLIDRYVRPTTRGPRWLHSGEELPASDPRKLRRSLSGVMNRLFPKTPRIHNEMIVRHKPTAIVINSRKKLLLGILERSGKENLGLVGNFPDSSIFRTVLLNTGLYRHQKDGRWWYATPQSVRDPGLRAVWGRIRDFVTSPGDEPKELRRFFSELQEPPFGVRAGLLPILFAAGLKAFPSALSLTRDGEYVEDILPSEVELLCREPERYRLRVLDLDEHKVAYLRGLHKCFSPGTDYQVPETDLIRMCFDAIEAWKAQLPPAALLTHRLSPETLRFQSVLRQSRDPVQLLLRDVPAACGLPIDRLGELLKALCACQSELAGVVGAYRDQAGASIRSTLAVGGDGTAEGLRSTCRRWAGCFADAFVEGLADGVAKGLLSRMAMEYNSDEFLLESLSSLLIGKPMSRWDDGSAALFGRELQEVVHRIEAAALSANGRLEGGDARAAGLVQLIRARTAELVERLVQLVGRSEAAKILNALVDRSTEGDAHGHDAGSVGKSVRRQNPAHR